MKRILLMVIRNIFLVPFAWFRLCYRASHVDKYTEEDMYRFLQWIDLHAKTCFRNGIFAISFFATTENGLGHASITASTSYSP